MSTTPKRILSCVREKVCLARKETNTKTGLKRDKDTGRSLTRSCVYSLVVLVALV